MSAPAPHIRVIQGANLAMVAVSGLFGVFALTAPERVLGRPVPDGPDVRYFREMYGVRSLVIAAVGSALLTGAGRAPTRRTVATLLSLGAVQTADAVIAARGHVPGRRGAAVAAIVHGASAAILAAGARGR